MLMTLQPFFIALQFLTVLPVPVVDNATVKDVGRSLLFYPVVGALIGLVLCLVYWLSSSMSELVAAALLLAVWVLLTGGLHLDGLADTADAWIGGFGDRERTLAIMKDPYCGPAAVVLLVVVLFVKLATLEDIVGNGNWIALLLVPVLGRTVLPLLFLTTPYVRHEGLGAALAEHFPRWPGALTVVGTGCVIGFVAGKAGVWLITTAVVVFVVLRAVMLSRIGGTTGDTAGTMVELVETTTLLGVGVI